MTKKWLKYVVLGALCCSIVGFAVAKQLANNTPAERTRLNQKLAQVENQILKFGPSSELSVQKTHLQNRLDPKVTNVVSVSPEAPAGYVAPVQSEEAFPEFNRPTAAVGRVATPEEREIIAGRVPASIGQPMTPDQERAQLLADIERLQSEGRDYTAQKTRYNELAVSDERNGRHPLDQGGETCADAAVITTLPYCDQGTTVGAIDNYSCTPGAPGFSGDVVYRYTPATAQSIVISLCGNSSYDTRLIVYSGACPDAGGVNIVCNDDFCGLQSCATIAVTAGTVYYIIIDAFSGGSGAYTLKVEVDQGQGCSQLALCPGATGRCCYGAEFITCANNTQAQCDALGGIWNGFQTCESQPCPNCNVVCGPNDISEASEADTCSLPNSDPNGGCNNGSGVYTYLDIACDDTVCGQAFTYIECTFGGQYRDTDWIRVTTTESSIISYSAVARFDGLQMFLLDGDYCTNFQLYGSLFIPTCGTVGNITSQCLPAGEYIIWAGYSSFSGLPYGGNNNTYRAWVDCTPCTIPLGRCCYYNAGVPSCATNYQLDCNGLGGLWTEGEDCELSPCLSGRCCYNGGSACQDLFDFDCAAIGGQFDAALTCAANPCDNLCALECDPFDIIEPDDLPGYCGSNGANDPNGGCNVIPPSYQDIACGDIVCGTAFTCDATFFRDTDWYRFTITEAQDVTVQVWAEFAPGLYGILNIDDCSFVFFEAIGFLDDCTIDNSVTAFCLPAGTYAAFFAPNMFQGLANPADYRLSVTCGPATNCPVGRCCYDGGLSCVDNTAPECDALFGQWDLGFSCAFDPCPIPPVNDDCGTATEVVIPQNGNVSAQVNNGGANNTCTDFCDYSSTGPDQFFYFTLNECRLIAIIADPNDPHISLYNDGDCCGTAILCNDDWGNNLDLDTYAWLPPLLRPTAGFGSMIADSLPAGTYYLRAGNFGAGFSGVYDLTFYDFGPCVIAPCDPVVDLTAYVATAGGLANHIELHFTAPQDEDYKVWSTINPNNDGNPNDGADPDWTLEATLVGLTAGPHVWVGPVGFVNYVNFVVTAVCNPFVAPVGRCCYGASQCGDISEADCNELGGFWDQFLNCTSDPCPPPPPANDDCGGAIEVFNNVPLAGSTVSALQGADITGCTFSDTYDVWYVYNATTTNAITASLCEATFTYDTGLSAWSACGGTELACNDDFCSPNGLQSQITWTPAAVGPQYIRVSGYNNQTGPFTLTVTQ